MGAVWWFTVMKRIVEPDQTIAMSVICRRDTTMQAMEIKWPAVNRIVVAGIAVAILTAGTIGGILLNQSEKGTDSVRHIGIPSLPASSVTQAEHTRYLEQNTELPAGGSVDSMSRQVASVSSQSVEQMLYIEQNTWLPGGSVHQSTVTGDGSANSPVVNR